MTTEQPNETAKAPWKNKKILIVAIAVAVIAVAGVASGLILMVPSNSPSSNQGSTNSQSLSGNQNSSSDSWMVKGAYATYAGNTSILSMQVTFTAKMEIVNVNETFIQVQTDVNISTPYGNSENTTTTWVNKQDMNFAQYGLTLNGTTSNQQVTIPGVGTRTCTVYQYTGDGISATYYIDNTIHWPVKMVMTSPESVGGQSLSMDIELVSTNITGL